MANPISEANSKKTIPSNSQNGTAKSATAESQQQNGSASHATNGASAQSKKAQKAAKDAHVAKANEHLLRAWKLISERKDSDA